LDHDVAAVLADQESPVVDLLTKDRAQLLRLARRGLLLRFELAKAKLETEVERVEIGVDGILTDLVFGRRLGYSGAEIAASRLVPLGGSLAVTSVCTPKVSFSDPDISLNFSASISENDSINTKKHIKSTIKSANVISHGGDPWPRTISGCSF
jgi:hypothetical protein